MGVPTPSSAHPHPTFEAGTLLACLPTAQAKTVKKNSLLAKTTLRPPSPKKITPSNSNPHPPFPSAPIASVRAIHWAHLRFSRLNHLPTSPPRCPAHRLLQALRDKSAPALPNAPLGASIQSGPTLRPASLPRLSRHNPIDPRIRPLEVLHKRSYTSIRVTEPAFIPLRSPAGDGNRCRSAKIGPGRAESPLRSCRQSPLGPVQGRFTVRVTRDGDSGSEGKARLSPASSTLTLAKRVSPDGCLIHARAHSACPVA
jgi:hypothetical protein